MNQLSRIHRLTERCCCQTPKVWCGDRGAFAVWYPADANAPLAFVRAFATEHSR